MGRRAMHLAFHDHLVDHLAAVIDDGVVQNPGLKSVRIQLHHGDVQLQGVGQGQVADLLLQIWHLERRHIDMARVQ